MTIEVRLFGPQAQLVQRSSVRVVVAEPATCETLRAGIARAEPKLAPTLAGSRFAVNHEYVAEHAPITEGDEVALIGMVSGG